MAEADKKETMSQHPDYLIDPITYGTNLAKVEQILSAVHELSERIDKMHELHRNERKDFWEAINNLRESITGNNYVEYSIMLSCTANQPNIQELRICNTAHNSLCYSPKAVI